MAQKEKGAPPAKRRPSMLTHESYKAHREPCLFADEPGFHVRTYRGRARTGNRILRYYLGRTYGVYYCDHVKCSPVWYALTLASLGTLTARIARSEFRLKSAYS